MGVIGIQAPLVLHPTFTFGIQLEVFIVSHNVFRLKQLFRKQRMLFNHIAIAIALLAVLANRNATATATFWFSTLYWAYIYIDVRKKLHRPRNPDTRATLKVTTEPNVDWAITSPEGDLVVSGWGSRTVKLPSNQSFVDHETKIRYAEYAYVAEVISGNGDAFISLTVEDNDEFAYTVACGRSGNAEVLYTMLNTGYGTRHWMVPGFLQGMPR